MILYILQKFSTFLLYLVRSLEVGLENFQYSIFQSRKRLYNHKCPFVRLSVISQNPSTAWNHHTASFILHLSSFFIHPSSLFIHPSSLFIHPSFILQLLSFSACWRLRNEVLLKRWNRRCCYWLKEAGMTWFIPWGHKLTQRRSGWVNIGLETYSTFETFKSSQLDIVSFHWLTEMIKQTLKMKTNKEDDWWWAMGQWYANVSWK